MPNETPKSPLLLTLDDVSQIARETLLAQGRHAPTVIAEDQRRAVVVQLEAMAATHEARAEQMFVLGFSLAASGEVGVLQQVFFISEAWMSIAEPGKPLEHPPSEDPKRKEVLLIARQVLKPPTHEVVIFEMQRDDQGVLRSLQPAPAREKAPDEEARNWLLNAFVIGFLGSDLPPDD
jgi:hypothetical protein